jgi:hypothetical protein
MVSGADEPQMRWGHTIAYTALPKAAPPGHGQPGHYRLRYDTLDPLGKMSLRRAGRMHHLGIGASHAGKRVLAIADDATVIELHTGEVLATNTIDPTKTYWRNTQKAPGRWGTVPITAPLCVKRPPTERKPSR